MSEDPEIVNDSPKDLMKKEAQGELIHQYLNQLIFEKDNSIERQDQPISPPVTRFIDIFEKEGKEWKDKTDEFGNSLELGGALGDIPPHQLPYIHLSNFNNVYIKLREGIYLDVYDTDDNGSLKKDEKGEPILKYTKIVNIGVINRKLVLLANLATAASRAKLQGKIIVGQQGGNPLGVEGSWDETLKLLIGGQYKK